ncbi:PepSY domain-containing protein [Afifella sp. IM 167]|uniref:PepSY domain-containing protein n=1 Tax=Afifella sp. IM 167 TaxID=2033586 RepID=UPI001CCC77FF|nr:hypothetical protein [Afifella sp. IM 167]MBZ8133920.1 hypothetical protein [Afifella sp. IM 167]
MNRFARIPALALALLPLLAAGAQAACLGSGEARQVVSSGQAMPLSAALSRAGVSGEVVNVQLCEEGGRYVYHASVLGSDGRVSQVSVPAN